MKKSARRKTDATQRHRISLVACRIFCGKLLSCPATAPMATGLSTESRAAVASPPLSVVNPRADMAAMHATTIHVSSRRSRGRRHPQKPKDPPGGQPGGSSYMGAGVDGRSRRIQPCRGGITAPTFIGRRKLQDVQNG